MLLRTERADDWRAVEELVREAFWNVYEPGRTSIGFCISCEKQGILWQV